MQKQIHLTRKQLQKETGVPIYIITYLNACGRLPIIKESTGKGIPTLYHPDAIKIIKDHIERTRWTDQESARRQYHG